MWKLKSTCTLENSITMSVLIHHNVSQKAHKCPCYHNHPKNQWNNLRFNNNNNDNNNNTNNNINNNDNDNDDNNNNNNNIFF